MYMYLDNRDRLVEATDLGCDGQVSTRLEKRDDPLHQINIRLLVHISPA
jgi:hypothetical protein